MIIENATSKAAERGEDPKPTVPTTEARRSGGNLVTMTDPYRDARKADTAEKDLVRAENADESR